MMVEIMVKEVDNCIDLRHVKIYKRKNIILGSRRKQEIFPRTKTIDFSRIVRD